MGCVRVLGFPIFLNVSSSAFTFLTSLGTSLTTEPQFAVGLWDTFEPVGESSPTLVAVFIEHLLVPLVIRQNHTLLRIPHAIPKDLSDSHLSVVVLIRYVLSLIGLVARPCVLLFLLV